MAAAPMIVAVRRERPRPLLALVALLVLFILRRARPEPGTTLTESAESTDHGDQLGPGVGAGSRYP